MDRKTVKTTAGKPTGTNRSYASGYQPTSYGGKPAAKSGYGGGKQPSAYNDDYDDVKVGGYGRRPSDASLKRPKSRYAALFAIVILAGAVICVSAFALMINSLSMGSSTPTPTPADRTGNLPLIENLKEVRQVCLIRGIDLDTQTLTLYHIDGGSTFYMTITKATEMKDSYGKSLLFGEFKRGDVVDIYYNEGESQLISIRQSAQAQLYTNQVGIIIDSANNRITRLNSPYIYGQELVCTYKGSDYDVANISSEDKITIRVYRNIVVYIDVVSAHGTVNIAHNTSIRDAYLTIDPAVDYKKLEDDVSYNLLEGKYQVIVKGSNIETFVKDIVVKGGDNLTVSLEDVEFKLGFLFFSSNINLKDIYLTVNGVQVDPEKSLSLKYGYYEIKATAMGYQPFEKIFEFYKPDYTFPITMEPMPTPTPRPERLETVKITISTSVSGINVPGAEVYVDDQYVGQTPITFDIELGSRSLLIRKEGFYDAVISPFIVTDEIPFLEKTFNLQEFGTALP